MWVDRNANVGIKLAVIVSILILSGLYFITKAKPQHIELIKGIVAANDDDVLNKYTNTLINYYDTETGWEPKQTTKTNTQPEIAGKSGILVDINTNEILFDKNSTQKLKIASLTKIMTAVVALEHKKPDAKIYVSAKAADIGENVMQISEGEIYTLEELLYGLILNSGNDSAYAIAEGTAGDSDTFVKWMNIKAQELGMNDTHFTDPSGLDDNTYSTPVDLVKLTRYALKNPKFKEIVKTYEKEIVSDSEVGTEHKYIYMQNQTNLLTTYPGVAGVKTGYTEEAGLCLVTYAANDDTEIVGVILNSIDRKGDMILMLDHGFFEQGVRVVHHLLD